MLTAIIIVISIIIMYTRVDGYVYTKIGFSVPVYTQRILSVDLKTQNSKHKIFHAPKISGQH